MSMIAIIPARGGSKGIKRKNLVDINGLPLVAYAILAAISARSIGDVYVSSEDNEILDVAELYGARPLKRPTALAEDHISTEAVIAHAFNKLKVKTMCVIQPTSPMLLGSDIDAGIESFVTNKLSCLFSAYAANDQLIWDEDGMYPLNYDPQRRGRRQTRRHRILVENGAFFLIRRSGFVKTGCRMNGKIGWSEMPYWRSFQIDTPEDLNRVKTLMALRY